MARGRPHVFFQGSEDIYQYQKSPILHDHKKKKLHSIFTIKRIIVPSAYGLVHGGRSSRQLVGGGRYPAAPPTYQIHTHITQYKLQPKRQPRPQE